MAFSGWSTTAASNGSTLGIDIAENCDAQNINNAMRQLMADLRSAIHSTWDSILNQSSVANIRTALGLGGAAVMEETTAAQFRANTADKLLSTDQVWSAAASVVLTPGTTVSLDLSSGINFTLAMGGNYTLAAPTNGKAGQCGCIEISQDATGSRTLAYNAAWKFANGTDPTLSTAASTKDLLFYQVLADGSSVYATLVKAIA